MATVIYPDQFTAKALGKKKSARARTGGNVQYARMCAKTEERSQPLRQLRSAWMKGVAEQYPRKVALVEAGTTLLDRVWRTHEPTTRKPDIDCGNWNVTGRGSYFRPSARARRRSGSAPSSCALACSRYPIVL